MADTPDEDLDPSKASMPTLAQFVAESKGADACVVLVGTRLARGEWRFETALTFRPDLCEKREISQAVIHGLQVMINEEAKNT